MTSRFVKFMMLAATVLAVLVAGSSAALAGPAGLATAASGNATVGAVIVSTHLAFGGNTAATGIVLSTSGEVLTNNHVIRGASAIRVTDPSSGRTYTASVLGYSVSKDIALLKLRNAHGLQTAAIGNSATIRVGDQVTAVGNAGGTGVLSTKSGRVTGLRQAITVSEEDGGSSRLTGLIETSAPLRPGDSGGPLLSGERVIGIDAAASSDFRFRESGGEGFAIPIATALKIARQVEAGQRSATVHVGPTAFLGVSLVQPGSFGQDLAGAIVDGVVPGSPAGKAGIASEDTIISFAGRRVSSATNLRNLVLRVSPGRTVRLSWIDSYAGRTSASVRLVSGPPQ